MNEHIDVQGASEAVYRFRRVDADAALPVMAGNYLFVREEPEGFTIVHSGEANTLSEARQRWAEARDSHGATHLFVRLNISQATRAQEHADIAERYAPPMA